MNFLYAFGTMLMTKTFLSQSDILQAKLIDHLSYCVSIAFLLRAGVISLGGHLARRGFVVSKNAFIARN